MGRYTTKVCGHRYGVYRKADDTLVETFAHQGSASSVAYLLELVYDEGYGEGHSDAYVGADVQAAYHRGYRHGVDDVE